MDANEELAPCVKIEDLNSSSSCSLRTPRSNSRKRRRSGSVGNHEAAAMDAETQKKVEETVLEVLRESDLDSVTEHKVRSAAASRLGLDLSLPDRKLFVRRVVESFLLSVSQPDPDQATAGAGEEGGGAGEEAEAEAEAEAEEEAEEEEEEEEEKGGGRGRRKEYDDAGDLVLCHLSNKRRVTLQEFRGKTLVSIREFYSKDGKEMPTTKGVSLNVEQWEAFRNAVPAIEDAIKKLGG